MSNRFSSGRHSIAACDVCGFRFKLGDLKALVIKTKNTNILACQECWSPDHPQLQLGMYPVDDPQAVRNPRPDTGYYTPGNDGAGGSRDINWGWAPVGGGNASVAPSLPNPLVGTAQMGSVTIQTT
jgi:hypothetical protein